MKLTSRDSSEKEFSHVINFLTIEHLKIQRILPPIKFFKRGLQADPQVFFIEIGIKRSGK